MDMDAPRERETIVTQLKQQRLWGLKWDLSPTARALLYLLVSALFFIFGAVFLRNSWRVLDFVHEYTEGESVFNFDIDEEVKPPIYIYYQLTDFYQNHRNFVKSVDYAQLQTPDPVVFSKSELSSCEPWISDDNDRIHYPCGLAARSVFNDSFMIAVKLADSDTYNPLRIETSFEEMFTETSDFRNVDPERKANGRQQNQEALDMWLLKRFPPVSCVQTNLSDTKPWVPATVALRADGNPDCSGYTTADPRCHFERQGEPFECKGDYRISRTRHWGIQSGHFNVWMNIAGLPQFRKLWGKIDTPLPAKSRLKVFVQNIFPTESFGGRKSFVLATRTSLGGRNDFVGYAYLVVGAAFALFGASSLFSHIWGTSR
eukprot:TRINITY_DN56448_c0_g1_i1.p1 TRINITY_DN56448_c0_g1~~TRINITY_DN56448_c0_g1_i1.p1  ORF type:complete len:373 (-),score=47.68 TRINITY_DN56448_c0_g1_i1:42-1160(-)